MSKCATRCASRSRRAEATSLIQPKGHQADALSPLALGAVAFWGVSFVATRSALDSFHPLALIATRLWLGAGLLVLIQVLRKRPLVPERRDLGRCLFLGLVNAVHLGLQAFGLLHTSAIRTGWIIAIIPVTIALGGQIFLHKRLAPIGWLGALVAMSGVFVVTMQEPPGLANARLGDLLQLASCVTWTIYTLASAKPVASSGALRTTVAALLVAALLATLAALAVGPLEGTSVREGLFGVWPPGAEALGATLFLGLACSGLAYWLWVSALQKDGPARIAAMLYFQPFVTLAASLVWRGEPVTATALIGGPIVLVGVWLVGRGSPQRTNVLRTRLERST